MKKYHLKVYETCYYMMEVEAENAKEAIKKWENWEANTAASLPNERKEGIVSVSVVEAETPEAKKDVHTEHCCLTCGCKYGDDNCSVVTERKKQSYPHSDDYCDY